MPSGQKEPGNGPLSSKEGPIKAFIYVDGKSRLQLEKNWLEIQAKVGALVRTWLRRRLSLNSRAEAFVTYVLPFIIYRLGLLPLCRTRMLVTERLLASLLWGGRNHWVCKEVCFQRPCHKDL